MNYRTYLEKHQYSENTIVINILRVKRYEDWTKSYSIKIERVTYKNLLTYVTYLKESKKYKRQSINLELRAVKLYYDMLIEKNEVVENPAENLTIRGTRKSIIKDILSEEELEDLYYSYDIEHHDTFFRATKQRDKVIVGLMVYQGVTAVELYQLKEEHLELTRGKIHIPSTRRSNRRTLKLQPSQIMELMEYTTKTRAYLSKRNNAANEEQLFYGSLNLIHSITGRIIKTLRNYNRSVKSYGQIRSSVIVNWFAKNNLRQVQYMAGHRYISSTERYLQDDLENLHEIINNFHPIN
ncbi:integrase/recombinase XerD [Aquimarina sp. MAR_2010_214]|uniref:tyrosine-type recombinase/integrase n=1 Tax=Aquimarina sp. MAR_2010_214 TaxID=1250026 RepID=UPI000C7005D2|nr:tyrosine-type recombinase/integrase [Aquimarina sp. MAR_2010_214]PKV52450.1 integrase/recombinase XerD [Aquimarina sp. MAR_2010_214]